MATDLQIARAATPLPITEIAHTAGIPATAVIPYGRGMAKIDARQIPAAAPGKLVLVTAINPTPAGEGKTTVSIGLADGLRRIGVRAGLALREPSLGPVFGVKGGAAGGGYAQVIPMEEINLHFTGDLHAITAANNLLAAMIDNHIQQGNELDFDVRSVSWRRCIDMNDRQLRHVLDGLGGKSNGVPREDGFDITAASEVMATFCLSKDLTDLKARLARLIVGYARGGKAITAGDLHAQGAMTALLRTALQPNLVQTLEGTPAFIHGGPFANIAHGCNSVTATRLAMGLFDVTVTEAGFGADLGAEKFLDIKCRAAGIVPSAVVIVATVRALKSHGGCDKERLSMPDVAALERGIPNLTKHIENMTGVYGLPVVVAVNRFESDSREELDAIFSACAGLGAAAVACEVWGKGGEGGRALAEAVSACLKGDPPELRYAYALEETYEQKIRAIARRVYGAADVEFSSEARLLLRRFQKNAPGLPVCMAKTQYSLSDQPKAIGRPEGFVLQVRSARLSAGAGFVVAFCGDIIAMPGLPKVPAACQIDVDGDGEIVGLF